MLLNILSQLLYFFIFEASIILMVIRLYCYEDLFGVRICIKKFYSGYFKSTGICQLPADVTDRYVEVFLVEDNQPFNLSNCILEVMPNQDKVEVLNHNRGSFLIQFLDFVNQDFTLNLTIYRQEFIRTITKFDVKFLKKQENINERKVCNQLSFPNKVKLIAHRGLSSLAPENTLPAYVLAGKYGYFGAECDIHESSDGEFVLMHDDTINRMTNGKGKVKDYTKDELKKFEITGNNYPYLRIPKLSEYLQVCKNEGVVPVIEIK